jgi:protocatechuate 3,4-dioxygenase alpha subunit
MSDLLTPSQTVGPFLSIGLTWLHGHLVVADDPRGASGSGFEGFGRCATDGEGRYEIVTVKPGALGDGQAPHIDVSVFARGLLDRVVTRIYFPDETAANAADPLLSALPPERAATLVADSAGEGALRFDIRLQGDGETVFLQV